MGLLDQLLGGNASQTEASGLAEALIKMLNDPNTGGLQGMLQQFQKSGLGDVFASWVGTGQNQPIAPDQLGSVLGPQLSQISKEAGVSPQQGGSLLAQLLPVLIDQLTPSGQLPAQNQAGPSAADLLKSLLR